MSSVAQQAADAPAPRWGVIDASGAFRPLPKMPMQLAGFGPPPFDVTLPSGEVRHIVEEPLSPGDCAMEPETMTITVAGPPGSGKTTLLRLISSAVAREAGAVVCLNVADETLTVAFLAETLRRLATDHRR